MSTLNIRPSDNFSKSLSLLNENLDTGAASFSAEPVVTVRAQRKEQTYQKILAAAADCFAQRGYQEATTREIAELSGVSVGTVFAHFPTKQLLLEAVLAGVIDAALARARLQLSPEQDAITALGVYARELYDTYLRQRPLARELLRASLFNAPQPGDQRAGFVAELQERMRLQIVDEQQRRRLANALFSHYFAVLISALGDPDSSVDSALAQLGGYLELYRPMLDG